MAGGPHGIQYHFLGQALVLDIPLQVFVADDVQYNSVAATGVVPTGWSRDVPTPPCPQWFILWRAVSARPYGATEVRCGKLIYKYKKPSLKLSRRLFT
jgi:hypothetical protein